MVIVIGGPGSSGSSTIAKMLAEYFNIERVYGGAVFRDECKDRGYRDLNEFYNSVSSSVIEEIDARVDENFRNLAKRGGVVIESKVFGAIATMENIPCTAKIWITADMEVRVDRYMTKNNVGWFGRIFNRSKFASMLSERYEYDKQRYHDLYGIDYDNPSQYYDIVLDSSNQSVDETFNLIVRYIENGRSKSE